MIAATSTPILTLDPGQYVCKRCGIESTFNTGRIRPALCGSCKFGMTRRELAIWA